MIKRHPLGGTAAERGDSRVPATDAWSQQPSGSSGLRFRQGTGGPSDAIRLLLLSTDPAGYQKALSATYHVEVADSGGAAAELLLWDNEFRLILCGHHLRDCIGSEFLREIRSLRGVRLPPIVIFGGEDPKEVIRCIQLGVRQYITGPCPPAELAVKVDRLLQYVRFARLAK
jgi:CheY-like chemotaxis protein